MADSIAVPSPRFDESHRHMGCGGARDLESLVARLTRRLLEVDPDRADSIIESSLETIAGAMAALRVRLVCFDLLGPGELDCFQYQRSDARTDAPLFSHPRFDRFAWSRRQLREHEMIEVPNVAELPSDAEAERVSCEALGVASLLSVPAFSQGKISAILTVQNDTVVEAFPEDEKRLLRVLAEIYTGALSRQRSERDRRSSEERFRALAEDARLAFERQLLLETRVAELSRFFVDTDIDSLGEGIESRLGILGELAEAQHSWIYSFSTTRDGFELFDWWRDVDDAARPVPPSGSLANFPYSTGLITSGQIYHVPNLDSLPEEGAPEQSDMRMRGVRSILGIPIMSGGRFVGCLGFESFDREVDWSEETIVLLRMAGEIFYSTLRRRRSVQDLRDSQSQLLQSQKMEAVGTLAGGIAHDFNNHLAVMLTNARFLRQEVDAAPEVLEAIDDLERSADHCAQLTRSLLAFARRSPVEIVPTDVDELVDGVARLVRPLLPGTIDFSVVLSPALGRFAVDRVQIHQVLVNLLVNARDSMPAGGPLRLDAIRRALNPGEAAAEGLREDGEYVVLSVEDAGSGMDEDTRGRVFEPFFTTKALGEGTGLGLAMAYGIIRQSDGAITVESQPDRGTIFRVYLPGYVDPA